MPSYIRSHLKQLEAESIYVMREVAAQFERPVLLFSGGKDSIVMSHLARKAFWPGQAPFPLLHIDTGHNFEETLAFRDKLIEQLGLRLIVRYVQDSIDSGRVVEHSGNRDPWMAPHGAPNVQVGAWHDVWVALDAMRKKPAPKSASSRTAMLLVNGIPKTNAPNCGISTMAANIQKRISASSR